MRHHSLCEKLPGWLSWSCFGQILRKDAVLQTFKAPSETHNDPLDQGGGRSPTTGTAQELILQRHYGHP